jgi:coenzyme F420 hydrogenase subunit beta
VARSTDAAIVARATDGGVVTALLLHLFDRGRIDGAIVPRQIGPFQREPFLATSRQEIIAAAGFFFDTSHGMQQFSEQYMTYSSIEEFDPMVKKGLKRVALVGTPCQINSVRRMQAMDLCHPMRSGCASVCSVRATFVFGDAQRAHLAKVGGFSWEAVRKVNIKETLVLHLTSGEVKSIPLEELFSIRRYACQFCADYSNELADLSFGGIGAAKADDGHLPHAPWARKPRPTPGVPALSKSTATRTIPVMRPDALAVVRKWSAQKKKSARHGRRELTYQSRSPSKYRGLYGSDNNRRYL